jgi:hypothetical protein
VSDTRIYIAKLNSLYLSILQRLNTPEESIKLEQQKTIHTQEKVPDTRIYIEEKLS